MPVRAVVDISVNDTELKEALATFEKLQRKIGQTPGLGGGVPGRVPPSGTRPPGTMPVPRPAGTGGPGGQSPAVQQATNVFIIMNSVDKKQQSIEKHAKATAIAWGSIKSDAKVFSDHIGNAARGALSFVSRLGIASAVGGVLGLGGSLFGLDRLASAASSGRRSSTGLGLSYGQQQAFGVTYGRILDAGGFLGGVSAARGDPRSTALWSLGINPSGPQNTGQMATEALSRIRQLTLRTPEHLIGTLLQSHGLSELGMDTESLRRIRSLSPGEFEQYQKEHGERSKQFDVSDKNLKGWQDLNVALIAAGQKIQSVLIEGLAPLAGPIKDLSEGFSEMVRSLLGGQGFKDLMKSATEGLKDFAHYVAGPKFKDDVLYLVRIVGDLASGFGRLLGLITGTAAPGGGATAMPYDEWVKKREALIAADPSMSQINIDRYRANHQQSYQDYLRQMGVGAGPPAPSAGAPAAGGGFGNLNVGPAGFGATPLNNPGNLRPYGSNTGFMQYGTPEQGIRAMAKDLLAKQNVGNDTIRSLIGGSSKWPGYSATDVDAYIRNVSEWTRMGPDQKFNLNDPNTMASLMAAMIRQEGYGKNPNYQQKVIVEVLNNTGGNAIVQTNQMGSGGAP